jgi:hypothetical protein
MKTTTKNIDIADGKIVDDRKLRRTTTKRKENQSKRSQKRKRLRGSHPLM